MSGLIQEILRKPTVKDIVRGHLRAISPGSGRELVKVLIWQDFEFLFSILGSIPAAVNNVVGGLAQLVKEIHDKFSPQMLKGYIGSILSDVDQAELKDCGKEVMAMVRDVLEDSPELKTFIIEQGPVYVARGINIGTKGINKVCLKDPALISTFLTHTIENLDKPALLDAVVNLVDAVLDQKLGIFALVSSLLKRRIAKLLKRFGLLF
jgi:hypothetical protein